VGSSQDRYGARLGFARVPQAKPRAAGPAARLRGASQAWSPVGRPFPWRIPIVAQTADLGPIDGSVRFRSVRPANIGRNDLLDPFWLDVEVLESRQGPAR